MAQQGQGPVAYSVHHVAGRSAPCSDTGPVGRLQPAPSTQLTRVPSGRLQLPALRSSLSYMPLQQQQQTNAPAPPTRPLPPRGSQGYAGSRPSSAMRTSVPTPARPPSAKPQHAAPPTSTANTVGYRQLHRYLSMPQRSSLSHDDNGGQPHALSAHLSDEQHVSRSSQHTQQPTERAPLHGSSSSNRAQHHWPQATLHPLALVAAGGVVPQSHAHGLQFQAATPSANPPPVNTARHPPSLSLPSRYVLPNETGTSAPWPRPGTTTTSPGMPIVSATETLRTANSTGSQQGSRGLGTVTSSTAPPHQPDIPRPSAGPAITSTTAGHAADPPLSSDTRLRTTASHLVSGLPATSSVSGSPTPGAPVLPPSGVLSQLSSPTASHPHTQNRALLTRRPLLAPRSHHLEPPSPRATGTVSQPDQQTVLHSHVPPPATLPPTADHAPRVLSTHSTAGAAAVIQEALAFDDSTSVRGLLAASESNHPSTRPPVPHIRAAGAMLRDPSGRQQPVQPQFAVGLEGLQDMLSAGHHQPSAMTGTLTEAEGEEGEGLWDDGLRQLQWGQQLYSRQSSHRRPMQHAHPWHSAGDGPWQSGHGDHTTPEGTAVHTGQVHHHWHDSHRHRHGRRHHQQPLDLHQQVHLGASYTDDSSDDVGDTSGGTTYSQQYQQQQQQRLLLPVGWQLRSQGVAVQQCASSSSDDSDSCSGQSTDREAMLDTHLTVGGDSDSADNIDTGGTEGRYYGAGTHCQHTMCESGDMSDNEEGGGYSVAAEQLHCAQRPPEGGGATGHRSLDTAFWQIPGSVVPELMAAQDENQPPNYLDEQGPAGQVVYGGLPHGHRFSERSSGCGSSRCSHGSSSRALSSRAAFHEGPDEFEQPGYNAGYHSHHNDYRPHQPLAHSSQSTAPRQFRPLLPRLAPLPPHDWQTPAGHTGDISGPAPHMHNRLLPPPTAPAGSTGAWDDDAEFGGRSGDTGADGLSAAGPADTMPGPGGMRLPFQQWMSQHAARLLLPHNMRNMADLFTTDMLWSDRHNARGVSRGLHSRERLSTRVSGVDLPGAAHGGGSGSNMGLPLRQHGVVFGKPHSARSGQCAGGTFGKDSPIGDLFCGRYPSKTIRKLASDSQFMAQLLTELPGVDPTCPAVMNMVLGLAGHTSTGRDSPTGSIMDVD